MHKCRAIPREEIALSFLKLPVRAGSNVSGIVPEPLIYRKFRIAAKIFAPAGLPGRGFFAEKFRRVLKMDFFTRAQSAKKRSQGEELSGMDNGGTLETA